MIQAIDLSKSYGEQSLFTGLTFTVPLRSRIALIARNGTGKSTLMDILAGVDTPDSGEVVRRYGGGMPTRCDQGAYSMPLRGGFGIR